MIALCGGNFVRAVTGWGCCWLAMGKCVVQLPGRWWSLPGLLARFDQDKILLTSTAEKRNSP